MDVYSNMLAAPYPRDPAVVPTLLAEHLLRPVEFVRQIEAMYDAGARIFVEVGPRNVVTGLIRRILEGRRHLVIPTDTRGRSCLLQLHHLLAQLAAHGVPVMLDRLYEGRSVRRLNLGALVEETREEPLPPTTWLVNGSRARPLYETVPSATLGTGDASAEGETFLR
jgi:acyl transferase domain-containing protein